MSEWWVVERWWVVGGGWYKWYKWYKWWVVVAGGVGCTVYGVGVCRGWFWVQRRLGRRRGGV